MSEPENESVASTPEQYLDRAHRRVSDFRFFVVLSTLWLVILIVLLRLEATQWLVAPAGLMMAALSLIGWAHQRSLPRREQLGTVQRSGTRIPEKTSSLLGSGSAGSYLVLA